MKNVAFTPLARTQSTSMSKVLHPVADTGEWMKTSVCLRKSMRQELKAFAATHDMTIQQVIDDALAAYLRAQAS